MPRGATWSRPSKPITIVGRSTPLSATSPQSRQTGKPYNPVSTVPGEGQQGNPLGEAVRADLSARVDRLANRLGARRLYRVMPVESDLPERSVRSVAPLAPPAGAVWPEHWPRPSRLLSPPEPIETVALLPDHAPAQFIWRGVRRRITRADGPERV